ncbi:MAG: class I SAM-dependent methyltransferase [Proteobacteria bacterium]|uniref:class I SAM-dependent methyltransferase n=1 Tax=Aquabacterium sp. TaxID=1872578 RepID=UPI0035C6AC7F|nr:class I SAM-dependent methyltransferase [Pseudomonadota bacterium]
MDAYYLNRRPQIARLLGPEYAGARILEIGCGAGYFRESIPFACEYWGVEPVPSVAKEAERRLQRVLVGTFKQVYGELPDHFFDCVVCNDVIEHMDDEAEFLELIKQKIKPGAVLIGSIPNVRHISNLKGLLIDRDWEYADGGILDRTHLRFFTQKSLLRMFGAHGYEICELQGINSAVMNWRSPGAVVKQLAMRALTALLGSDSRYMQFSFKVRPQQ